MATGTPTATPTPISAPLAQDISADAGSILVDDISLFPDSGTIRIDQEWMTYDGKEPLAAVVFGSDAVAQPGRLLHVVRGADGSTATAHFQGEPVTLVPPPVCVGDCDGSGVVTIDDLLTMVNVALGYQPFSRCPLGDAVPGGRISVDQLVRAVNNAVDRCPP